LLRVGRNTTGDASATILAANGPSASAMAT
jgi:hypothetical protein